MGLLIFFFCVSIIFSFLCSIWEAVLLSITPSYTQIQLQKGTKVGQLLNNFKANVDRPLSAILTLNTIAHTVGAMGVGAQAESIWSSGNGIDIFGLFIGANAIVGVVMTLAILILSEIIPKTLGANYWKALTPFTVNSLNIIITLLFPLVWISQLITKSLKEDKGKSVLSRADFTAMAELGRKEGVFQHEESTILANLMRFNKVQAQDIMTPRTVVKAEEQEVSIQEFHDKNPNLRFSRIPIYEKSKDAVTGFVLKNEILINIINGNGSAPLKSIIRDLMIVKIDFPIQQLFNRLMEKREHIALVVGEFGGMQGIVTMEDVIETLLGMEIVDELDDIADMQALARKNWEKRAKNLGIIEE